METNYIFKTLIMMLPLKKKKVSIPEAALTIKQKECLLS